MPTNTPSRTHCPACHSKGKTVKRITLESLLTTEAASRIGESEYRFCDTLDCNTVYFAQDGTTFTKKDLTVRVGVKEHTPSRHVCYCFDHTIEEIYEEIAATGGSTVLDDIKTRMKTACWCETKSPMGSCCLGTVNKYVKLGLAEQHQDDSDNSEAQEFEDCCASQSPHEDSACATKETAQRSARAGTLATGGSVLTAALSSACCWLPLLLIAFGTSAAGVSMFFEHWRPYFGAGAIILLGLGFYLAYFRAANCPDDCRTHRERRSQRLNRATLWVSAVVVMAFLFFPKYVGAIMDAFSSNQTVATIVDNSATTENSTTIAFDISGMSCEACAVTLRSKLQKIPGVESVAINFDNKNALIAAHGDTVVPDVVEVAKKLGFTATASKNGERDIQSKEP
jgi:copper chaperone CopZ